MDPLLDRLPSNSSNDVKPSLDWTTSSPAIPPLKIAKRDGSPTTHLTPLNQLPARRSSSSYKHLRNNNLVSKSPFKSRLPTPSTTPSSATQQVSFPVSPRRVSGEKRPRPISMQEQAEHENSRPFALKRERRQSKGFQGLIQKEPVTKSPFRRIPSEQEVPPPLPPKSPSKPAPTTPTRSSLVSRRLHGPRTSLVPKRQRRKTVTFDERCDVVEFDIDEEEHDENVFDSDNEFEQAEDNIRNNEHEEQDSFESVQLDEDIDRPQTPPHGSSLPPDLDTEDGVPYGRSHHIDRVLAAHQSPINPRKSPPSSPPPFPFASSRPHTPSVSVSSEGPRTPPAHQALELTSPPLGRSTHIDRVRAQQEHDQEIDQDVGMLPPSPSPSKPASASRRRSETIKTEALVPRFEIPGAKKGDTGDPSSADPFSIDQHIKDEPEPDTALLPDLSFDSTSSFDRSFLSDPTNLSIGNSEVSLSMLEAELGMGSDKSNDQRQGNSKEDHTSHGTDTNVTEALVPETSSESTNYSTASASSLPTITPQDAQISREGSKIGEVQISDREPVHQHEGIRTQSEDPIEIPNTGSGRSRVHPGRIMSPLPARASTSPSGPSPGSSSATRDRVVSPLPSRMVSPRPVPSGLVLSSSTSPSPSPASGRPGARMRISREDVQRRLMRTRSRSRSGDLPGSAGTSSQVFKASPVALPQKHETSQSTPNVPHQDDGSSQRIPKRSNSPAASLSTVQTDSLSLSFSAEAATIERAHAVRIGDPIVTSATAIFGASHAANFDAPATPPASVPGGSLFELSLGGMDVDMDMRSALDRLMDDVAGSASKGIDSAMRVEAVAEGVQAGTFIFDSSHPSPSPRPPSVQDCRQTDRSGDFPDDSMTTDDSEDEAAADRLPLHPSTVGALQTQRTVSGSTIPPPPPPKDAIRSREELILEKRREARRREEQESMGLRTPPRCASVGVCVNASPAGSPAPKFLSTSIGRGSRRRSMSTGDAEGLKGNGLLDVIPLEEADDPLADSIDRELKKLLGTRPGRSKYYVHERDTIYASSDPDANVGKEKEGDMISHMASAGDVDAGKAWRTVRRPSDMNEYSKQIKEYRAQEKPGKAHGKVFVKVLGVKGLDLPLPQQSTTLTCTLNNGIHFVTTPECRLSRDSRIDQEFELIEHSKLEFTLTLKIKRDPHIVAQFKALAPPPVARAPPPVVPTSSKGGMLSFFSSSPKKNKSKSKAIPAATPPPPVSKPVVENLARYLKTDGTLARAFVSFKDVAIRCDTRLFETSYPLIGQRTDPKTDGTSALQVGELVLQLFRLPPLPGIKQSELPQSLEECHRGLRHTNWHKAVYFEGTLTQNGGDCKSWRRRQLRVIGSNLVAFNEVTKKATATIDLKKAIAVEDDQDIHRENVLSPSSVATTRSTRHADEYEGLYGVERSFRLIFPHDQEIVFFADTDDEKTKWLEVLRALVGHIPPNPLWAELAWQRQHELAKPSPTLAAASSSGLSSVPMSRSTQNAQARPGRNQR